MFYLEAGLMKYMPNSACQNGAVLVRATSPGYRSRWEGVGSPNDAL
jgi:hypothetical protein